MMCTKGTITDAQRFSTQDGPGIRTTVFLKGCSLRCEWCHNPETIDCCRTIGWDESQCIHCGLCAQVCTRGAISSGRESFRRERCVVCGACVSACLENALKNVGYETSPEELVAAIEKDKLYYKNSGGGVTLSGGEPLLQADFFAEVFKLCKQSGIHTALDTAANVPWSALEKTLPYTDMVLFDIKMTNSECHKQFTGADNKTILENFNRLTKAGVITEVRIPLIKGINDDTENAASTARLLKGAACVKRVRLLPYHAMGLSKRKMVGLDEGIEFAAPDKKAIARFAAVFDCPVEF